MLCLLTTSSAEEDDIAAVLAVLLWFADNVSLAGEDVAFGVATSEAGGATTVLLQQHQNLELPLLFGSSSSLEQTL